MTTVSGSAGTHRNGKIDFLRFVFAMVIVLHHTRYLLGDDHCLFLGGSLGVEFFFIVSGYLMMASAEHKRLQDGAADSGAAVSASKPGRETVQFLRRKLTALLPEFLIAWSIGFVFVAAAKHLSPRGILRMFIIDFWELTLLKMSGLFVKGFDGVIWYVSAMLIAMAILYPMLRRFPDMFPRVIAPLLCLFIMGYLMRTEGHPRNPTVWMGFAYKGLLRAAAELSLGVVVYEIADRIRRMRWTKLAKVLFTVFEAAAYLGCIAYMYARDPSKDDYFFIALMAAAIAVSFAKVSYGAGLCDNRLSGLLAKYSTALYFGHIYYAQHLNDFLPDGISPAARVILYLLCAAITAAVVMLLADVIRRNSKALRSLLLYE